MIHGWELFGVCVTVALCCAFICAAVEEAAKTKANMILEVAKAEAEHKEHQMRMRWERQEWVAKATSNSKVLEDV